MTTQPLLSSAARSAPDPAATFATWERALAEPTVRGPGRRSGAALSARRRCRARRSARPPISCEARQAAEAGRDDAPVAVRHAYLARRRPRRADPRPAPGWDATAGSRVVQLRSPAGSAPVADRAAELAVLPLAGSLTVEVDGQALRPRRAATTSSPGHRLGVPADRRRGSPLDAATVPRSRWRRPRRAPLRAGATCAADDVPVEIRGAGPATRQVTNF